MTFRRGEYLTTILITSTTGFILLVANNQITETT
jgi:hypothetical protein